MNRERNIFNIGLRLLMLSSRNFLFGEYYTNYTEMLKGGMICVGKRDDNRILTNHEII